LFTAASPQGRTSVSEAPPITISDSDATAAKPAAALPLHPEAAHPSHARHDATGNPWLRTSSPQPLLGRCNSQSSLSFYAGEGNTEEEMKREKKKEKMKEKNRKNKKRGRPHGSKKKKKESNQLTGQRKREKSKQPFWALHPLHQAQSPSSAVQIKLGFSAVHCSQAQWPKFQLTPI
jgi:hypothetical protein